MENSYNFKEIEAQAQNYWDKTKSFEVNNNPDKKNYYILSMFPYPSGQLHMGHIKNYTISDVIARYHILKGYKVLQPMGWDAFGLPAENAAIKHERLPSEWTNSNIKEMKKQFKNIGFGFDWSRELMTCDPNYYKWEQWLFIKLYEKNLVYKKKSFVNWDPIDETVLANEQVINGRGWRSNAIIEKKEIEQWFIRITSLADELITDLDLLPDWPDEVKLIQKNWIGKSSGCNILFKLDSDIDYTIDVFTTRPDTIYGVSYIAIAPEHPLAHKANKNIDNISKLVNACKHQKTSEATIAKIAKEGYDTGMHAINPINNKKIPIWVCNYILMDYGSGAVMAVPAHDQRDFEFAKENNLSTIIVIDAQNHNYSETAYSGSGKLINSELINGKTGIEAGKIIIKFLEENKCGEHTTHYRLRDWGVSRQRYWGTPIPMIKCQKCGILPVPEKDLPVRLPLNVKFNKKGQSPLQDLKSFYNVSCHQCGSIAKRETDTLDTFVDSSWYFSRFTSTHSENEILDPRATHWLPVDQYIGGIEHATMHLLYARFIHKIMFKMGLVKCKEPFMRLLNQGHVTYKGSKMSKSKGNIVMPNPLLEKYGADAIRVFSIFSAPPEQSSEWSDGGMIGSYKFLKKLWMFIELHKDWLSTYSPPNTLLPSKSSGKNIITTLNKILVNISFSYRRQHLNTVVSSVMKIFNLIGTLSNEDDDNRIIIYLCLKNILIVFAPIAPHLTHVAWKELKYGENILNDAEWPIEKIDKKTPEEIDWVIQVNGKTRGKTTLDSSNDEDQLLDHIRNLSNISKHLENKTILKTIIIKNKLINIVTG
jgi:leucyl-tRNA synthetase